MASSFCVYNSERSSHCIYLMAPQELMHSHDREKSSINIAFLLWWRDPLLVFISLHMWACRVSINETHFLNETSSLESWRPHHEEAKADFKAEALPCKSQMTSTWDVCCWLQKHNGCAGTSLWVSWICSPWQWALISSGANIGHRLADVCYFWLLNEEKVDSWEKNRVQRN